METSLAPPPAGVEATLVEPAALSTLLEAELLDAVPPQAANRDTDGHVFNLQFETASCLWELLEEEIAEYREEPLFPFLIALLADTPSWQGTATELCETAKEYSLGTEYTPATIGKRLRVSEQVLFNKYGIEVRNTVKNNTKIIRLQRFTNTAIR